MSKYISSILIACVLLAGASPVMARLHDNTEPYDLFDGYNPYSPEGSRAFWDALSRRSGG